MSSKILNKSSSSFEGTDLIIASLLRNVVHGTYIDVGANHPNLYNNTFLFYMNGWSGIALDGNIKFADDWSSIRPKDIFLNTLVSDCKKEVSFNIFPDDSMSSIDFDTIKRYSERFDPGMIMTQTVTTTTIFDIWREYSSKEIHLLSIDVEGEEDAAIKGAKLETFRPGVISVEIKNVSLYSPMENCLVNYITNLGYRLIAKTPLDTIFIDPTKSYLKWIPDSLVKL